MSKFINLGNFQVESGSLMVTDPCYGLEGIHNEIPNAANGMWMAFAILHDGIVEQLVAFKHGGQVSKRHLANFYVYVDSGQAGIFDTAHYSNDEDVAATESFENVSFRDSTDHSQWYKMCCDRTLGDELAGVIPFGIVSSSGYGDGSYCCYYAENEEGQVAAVQIVFAEHEDEEDEEDEE